ncbi:MAG: helix-turn-helix transcriptional regulator [Thaumarchaeota archaeon]|nr:helix-turn-helix transcriptional regulator [Nitrososphaerota archaeon]
MDWFTENMATCPINNAFKIMGKKFTVLLLRNMVYFNDTRFSQFLQIEGINPKTLSVRLRDMKKEGLIQRKVFPETPVRIEYSLTGKGKALIPILEQMAEFSTQHCSKDVFKDGKPRNFQEVLGAWKRIRSNDL